MNWQNYLTELKRRHVIKAGIAYLVVAWLVLQVLSILFPAFDATSKAMRTTIIILGVGFPIWLVIAWVYDFSPEGIKRTEDVPYNDELSRKKNIGLNRFIIGGLSIAVILLLVNTVRLSKKIPFDADGRLTLAVLPFNNFSPDPDNEWIGDGVTEDLLTQLSKIDAFRVISRTSVMKYKGTKKTMPEIAKELGATYILEGSVRLDKDEVLVTAQLVDREDYHLWADSFKDDSKNIFTMQADVAKKVSRAILGKLKDSERTKLDAVEDIDPEAMKNYALGSRIFDRMSDKYWKDAETYFEQAIEIEPKWVKPLAALSYAKVWYDVEGAKQLASKALSINPSSDQATATMAIVLVYEGKYLESIKLLKDFVQEHQDAPWSHDYLASLYLFGIGVGKDFEKGLYHSSEAVKIDPMSQIFARKQIFALILLERFKEADSLTKAKESIFDTEVLTQIRSIKLEKLAEVKSRQAKDYNKAIEVYQSAIDTLPDMKPYLQLKLAQAYNSYFNDNAKYLEFTEKAWLNRDSRVDDTMGAKRMFIVWQLWALLENGKFKEAWDFIYSDPVISGLEASGYKETYIRSMEFDYYLSIGEFNRAQDKVNGNVYGQALIDAYRGKHESVYEALKNDEFSDPTRRAELFAIMKVPDSLFYYLNQDKIDAPSVNGNPFFDPYRKDPRFIAFRKKHYLEDVSIE